MAVFDAERLKESAGKFAKGFTPGQKVITGLLAAILVIAGVAYNNYAGKPQYVALFSNLTPTDASAITSKLTSDGVPYQLASGGTAILVPQSKVDQERMTMATANLPAGGSVGLELMDKEGITTSQAVQSADYQRALQGELESTIGSISGVTGAQVTLALPQQSDFVIADDTKPTASVLVAMGAGQTLSTGQVTGIVHLVASSIPKLDAGNVTVVDSNGNVLAAPGVGITAGGGTDAAQGYEQALAAKITAQLDQVVGVGHANVQVTANVDTAQTSSTTETLVTDPKGKVVSGTTSSSSSTEKYGSGSTSSPAGILGTTATSTGSNTTTNTTGTAAGTGTATGQGGVNGGNTGTTTTTTGNGGYTKITKDEQYALGKSTITKDQPPGSVNNVHVAVLVDSASKANIATLTKLANTTAGINAKRGDSLTVVQMPFSTAAATAAKTAAKEAAKAKSASATTGLIRLVVAILGVLAMIVLLLRSTKREQREEIAVPMERLDQLALPSGSALPALPSPRTQAAAGELAQLIEEAPDEVAKVLRSWMHERSGRH